MPRNGTSCEGTKRCAFEKCIDPTKEYVEEPTPTKPPVTPPTPPKPPLEPEKEEEEGEEDLKKKCIFIALSSNNVYFCGLNENAS